ncbi:RING finger protein 151-like [Bombina bombina]|uniref:RING finger protein 151-like n=1 Tax=Bombina bombina TaxID=8345 RepID=UPI00235ABC2F|nr:RING finger protein 151-like [Bombina bombina]
MRCRNARGGCLMVCSLESIERHERDCEYSFMSCINAGCTAQFERRNLDGHLAVCDHRSRECPNGCGYTILSAEDLQHNCIAELRTELELLRSEMICRIEETKQEMESRLDSQRRHMVQKESILMSEIEELKSQMSRLMSDVRSLLVSERQHRQDLEQADLEKQELMEILKGLQKESRSKSNTGNHKPTNIHPLTRFESIKRNTREVTII